MFQNNVDNFDASSDEQDEHDVQVDPDIADTLELQDSNTNEYIKLHNLLKKQELV